MKNNYRPWKNYEHDPKKSEYMNTYDNLSPEAQSEVFSKAFWSGGDPSKVKPLSENTRHELSKIREEQDRIFGVERQGIHSGSKLANERILSPEEIMSREEYRIHTNRSRHNRQVRIGNKKGQVYGDDD